MERQNILFVLTDQQRSDSLGSYGNSLVATPNLDWLATSGTRFTNWYTPTAICTPARASLITGKAPFRHRVLANHERNVGFMEEIPHGEFSFAESLLDEGYNVGLFGKWHVGTQRGPKDLGFDGPHFDGWHNAVDHPLYKQYLKDRGLPDYSVSDEIRGHFPNGEPGILMAARLEQPVEATFEHFLADLAIERIEKYAQDFKDQGKPFFLALHFFGPHLPYILPSEYFDMYDLADIQLPESVSETFENKPPVQQNYSKHWGFDTMTELESRKLIAASLGYVSMIDMEIGRVFKAMQKHSLIDDSAIFFSSDHGEFTGSHKLHDKGPAMYDDIYKIAGLVKVPGGIAGQIKDEMVSLLDCTATILELAGADKKLAVDSVSLLPLLKKQAVETSGTQEPWRDFIVCEYHGHHFPYPQRMIRDKRYKLVVNPESVNELYDLESDPSEMRNEIDNLKYEAITQKLMVELYQFLVNRGDKFFHWMTSMYPVGKVSYDPSMGQLDKTLGAK
jgi:arylsulfatase A-like enzyme